MQEVFKKIINRFDELLKVFPTNSRDIFYRGNGFAYKNAKEIVQEVAKEYNNGWIPVSSGKLPEERETVEITVMEDANEVGGKRYYNVRSWLQDGRWIFKRTPYHPEVIAWREITEPYQPKESDKQ